MIDENQPTDEETEVSRLIKKPANITWKLPLSLIHVIV